MTSSINKSDETNGKIMNTLKIKILESLACLSDDDEDCIGLGNEQTGGVVVGLSHFCPTTSETRFHYLAT